MTSKQLHRIFQPLTMRGVTLRNRLFLAGHDTHLESEGQASDAYRAYIEARARGGAGLVITGAIGVAESMLYGLNVDSDEVIPPLTRLAEACHRHSAALFGQLMHPGRYTHAMPEGDGRKPFGPAPSAVPWELGTRTSRELTSEETRHIIAEYEAGAGRLAQAGFDGAEILFSHGYLPVQFTNPRLNQRTDQYGGSFENRLRFGREVIAGVRRAMGEDRVVGIRISGDEMDHDGLKIDEAVAVCQALDADGQLDYFNVTAGGESTERGLMYYIPPMGVERGYAVPLARQVRDVVEKPVFNVGRIVEPTHAERILEEGHADACGMARALICDPELPNKAAAGRLEDIRNCIGCNQACIGRYNAGFPISCIQHPETGRELIYEEMGPAANPKKVIVVGGGPGGMKAAAAAAGRGHEVTLCEREAHLGGQALLAQLLPGRAEFGGIVENLAREMKQAGVKVQTKTPVDRAYVERERPDVVVLATGGQPLVPEIEGAAEGHLVTAWQVLEGTVDVGSSILVADAGLDWVGMGISELLARRGNRVRLAITGHHPGMFLDHYTKLFMIGQLAEAGVEVIPNVRLYGVDENTGYLQHTITHQPVVCDEVDSVVLALGHLPDRELVGELSGVASRIVCIGDCVSPRTAVEAVLEGLEVAVTI